ncbi:MAG: CoA-binding protein [Anaerolineaceae bacterium]|nr:CoA-binding protein [Anaerolineaceae bacterium]
MINSQKTITEFMNQKSLAVVGVSRNKDKFGNMIYRDLKKAGYKVFAINPQADMLEGDRCYAGLGALPEKVGGVMLIIPPTKTVPVIEEAARLGINYIWLQQGAESPEAELRCRELGLEVVSGECIYLYLKPVESIHKVHRFLRRLFGKMPK